jgi:plasmid stabilization system protein ParE
MNEAADYYETAVEGLGKEFLDEISAAIEFVKRSPEACQIVFLKARRIVLHRFPYSIFYAILPDKIWILAVSHQKRRPLYWVDRM